MAKGEIGEDLVQAFFEAAGHIVYRPATAGAHAFDMLCIKDKKWCVAVDTKTKARLNKWRATGINQRHYEGYEEFSRQHTMPFWIVFVDEMERRVYGNELSALESGCVADGEYWPQVRDFRDVPTRLYHLDQMIHIADLDDERVEQLKAMSQRNYNYEGQLN